MTKKISTIILISIFFLSVFSFVNPIQTEALSVSELKEQIELKRKEKEELEKENRKLEQQILETGKQANTLGNAVEVLDKTQRKLENDLAVTRSKISGAELAIEQLSIEIQNSEDQISKNKEAIAKTIRSLNEAESKSFIEAMLQYDNFGEMWNDIETLRRFQDKIRQTTRELSEQKIELSKQKGTNEEKKKDLTGFKEELSDKKVIVDENKKAKTVLLTKTKNREAEYKKLLEKNLELGRKFEQELFEFESQLKIAIDESRLPTERSGVLSWPLDSVFITQKFGMTVDSKRLYKSGTHNGIDFRATVGTPVKSIYGGVVKGTGNTDDQPGCFSFGRWALIEHPNGLSSMYAHLSGLKVSQGQSVAMGETIGYSGGQPNTSGAGYSTGPHLHLTIYASQGVSVKQYTASNFCKQVSIPIAPSNAYLDPLQYLPRVS